MANDKKQKSGEVMSSLAQEQVKPLFEDMGNTHVHDEKSYNDLKKQNNKNN